MMLTCFFSLWQWARSVKRVIPVSFWVAAGWVETDAALQFPEMVGFGGNQAHTHMHIYI